MSQKTARASAREIRRAFGPAAIQHIDEMDAALVRHAGDINAIQSQVKALSMAHVDHYCECRQFRVASSLRQRLRWLFTGK